MSESLRAFIWLLIIFSVFSLSCLGVWELSRHIAEGMCR